MMLHREYIYSMGIFEPADLLPQVSWILEQITQQNARKKSPGLWKVIDKLNSGKRASEAELKRRRARKKVWGGLFLVMGIFLFVPGIMQPQELTVPLVVGFLAILLGIRYLRREGKKKNPFDASSEKLLTQLNSCMHGQKMRVSFSEEGIAFTEEGTESEKLLYETIEYSFETENLFALVYDGKILLFQKKELLIGIEEEFRKKLESLMPFYKAMNS